jgi:radical SAM protein with 4Fe4S-binding SPASM domain
MRVASRSFLPANAVIELTYRCNHDCIFCSCPWFCRGNGFEVLPELETDHWKSVIRELCGCGVSAFAFTGGEALMRDDCLELLEFASSMEVDKVETVDGRLATTRVNPDVYLLSNGAKVDERLLGKLAGLGINLSLSLPGLSTFRCHTGRDGADRVLELFSKARKAGIPTTVNSTVTALNLFELRKTLTAAFLAGAGQLLMNRFLPGGRGLEHSGELSMNADQVREMLLTADDVLTRAGRSGNLGTELPLCILEGLQLKTLKVGTRCSAALKFFVIGPSGYVRVCNHSERRLAHIDNWKELKNDPYWRTFTLRRYLPAECSDCRLKTDCDGGCREAAHIAGGRVDSKDPLL